jgi:CD36 family
LYFLSQTRKKNNIRISRDKERASYFSQMTFHFNAEKSAPLKEDDPIVVLNMHMNVSKTQYFRPLSLHSSVKPLQLAIFSKSYSTALINPLMRAESLLNFDIGSVVPLPWIS